MGGTVNFSHDFDQPVDLATFDYIAVDMVHNQSSNPLDSILIYLTNGNVLELQNVVDAPFGPKQTKFPIYDFHSRYDVFRHHATQVSSLLVVMSLAGTSPVTLDAIRLVRISPKPPLGLKFTLGGARGAVIEASRQMSSGEVYRLEASNDLIKWFDKGQKVRGDGSTPMYEKYLSDARFYRMSYYNYVDTAASP